MIIINREKAEALTLDRLRLEREPLWADLDLQAIRAIEDGQDTAEIVAKKKALRDVTEIDLSVLSIEQLAVLTVAQAIALYPVVPPRIAEHIE